METAAIAIAGVAGDGAIDDVYRADTSCEPRKVTYRTAEAEGSIRGKGATHYVQSGRSGNGVVVNRAAVSGRRVVTAECGIADGRRRRGASIVVIIEEGGAAGSRVAAEDAVADRQRTMVIIDAAANSRDCAGAVTVCNRKIRDRDGFTVDMKHAARVITAH